ncbi:MAG: hypothetical protein H0U65_11335 [Rubrobacter sp.]|jgi:hypothetical protein|nr:hypothetical protein [Rubrobacter sp.]
MNESLAGEFERVSRDLPDELVVQALRIMEAARGGAVEQVVLARALRQMREGVGYLPEEALVRTASESEDRAVFLTLLSAGVMDEFVEGMDELAKARVEGLAYRRELLEKAGGALGVSDVAELLGLSRDAVDKRRKGGRLIAVVLGRHGMHYPAFQFTENGLLEGLERALKALEPEDGWVALQFFLEEEELLGGKTSAEALESGEVEEVAKVAEVYGEQVGR